MSIISKLKKLSVGISVLYVEDDEAIREKTKKILSRIFSNIEIASNGIEGLSLYMKSNHDLIISDIVMGRMNGIEMVHSIKSVKNEQSVIFLSAYTDQNFLIEAIELGVSAFVFKPIDVEKFYSMIEKTVKHIILKKENLEYKNHLEKLVEQRTNDLKVKNEELEEMIVEVKKGNQLKEEMQLAQKVQKNFLPKKLLSNEKLDVSSFFQAATYVGGDYYDLFYSSEDVVDIIIADVSGHGLAPAITMSTFRGICRSILSLSLNLEEQVSLINKHLCNDSKNTEFFITAAFIRYYEKENIIKYISAGHNDVLFYNNKNNEIQNLKSTAIPLAIFEDTKYKIIEQVINKEDFLVLYTDGLIEARNSKKQMYTLDRLISIVKESSNNSSDIILNNIVNSLNKFIKKQSIDDDTTILVTKFTQ